jgi:hypothetical protein
MALDKDRLGDAFVTTVLDCLGGSPVSADITKLRTLMRALADDIITEFIDNAEIESDGQTETHSPGDPASIVDLPGVIKQ